MKTINLIGNLGTDATINDNGNYSVLNFALAVNERTKNKDGTYKDKAVWFQASIWRSKEILTKLVPFFKKGAQIFLTGDLKAEIYKETVKLTVLVEQFKILSKPNQNEC